MNIPPPPWRAAGNTDTQAPEATAVPPPPWRSGGVTSEQFKGIDEQASTYADQEAHAEISNREGGWGVDTDGNFRAGVKPSIKLSPDEKTAIIQAHRMKAHVAGPAQTGDEAAALVRYQSAQTNTPYQNFAAGASGAMARAGLGLTRVLADTALPNVSAGADFAGGLQATQEAYQTPPDSNAAFAGNIVGGGIAGIPALAAGPLGGAALMGAQTFGEVRNDVAVRRQHGEQITPTQELTEAGLKALISAGTSFVQIKALASTPQGAAFFKQGMADAMTAYAYNSGIAMTQAMANQLASNFIDHVVTDTDASYGQGVGAAGAAGAAAGAILTPVGAALHGGQPVQPNRPEAPTINPEALKAATTSPPALHPILEQARPKVRVNEGQTSRGIRLEFANPVEKALYVTAQPRQGKLGVEATKYLESSGVTADQIPTRSAQVKARVDQLAAGHQGDTLQIPHEAPAAEGVINQPPQAKVEAALPEAKAPASTEAVSAEPSHMPAPERITDEHVNAAVADARGDVKGFKEAAPANRDQAEAAKVFEKRGTKVVFFDGESRGFRYKKHPGILFVNRSNVGEGLREALSHEFMHELHDTRPTLFKEFSDSVPAGVRKDFESWYSDAFAKMRPGETPTNLSEEGVTMPFGQVAKLERVWKAVRGVAPSVMDRITDTFRAFAAKLGHGKSKMILQAVKTMEDTLRSPVSEVAASPRQAARRAEAFAPEEADFLPSHDQRLRDEAEEYAKSAGIPFNPQHGYAEVNVERAKQIAAEYDAATHNPNDPKVKASYDAFKKETLDQWNYLKSKGVKMEAWNQEGQPYKNSEEMTADVRNNKHLYFFQGGDMPADHPLADRAEGTPYTYNDVFRAVHDYFGHAKEGVGFGPRGEENAWRSHSQMYSEVARGAMTTETRGQNSWVNFGPHGEANRANPKNTTYAEQKATLLSPKVAKLDEEAPAFLPKNGLEKFAADEDEFAEGVCTDCAKKIVDKFGGKVVGYFNSDNPTATVAEAESGHDFALVGNKLVDPWAYHVEGSIPRPVLDRKADAKLIAEKYGDPSKWETLPGQSNPLPKPRGKKEADGLAALKKHLEPHELESLNEDQIRQAAKMYSKLPPTKEFTAAAKAGEAARGWYEKSAAFLAKLFGNDAPQFLDLLAATSPSTQVKENMRRATRIWAAWKKAGRPTDPEAIRSLLNEPRQSEAGLFGDIGEGKLGGMSTHFPNVVRALTGENLSGPKVSSFTRNLGGDLNYVTNDTWMAQFAGIEHKDFSTPAGYAAYTAKVRETAAKLGWHPAEVQETVWSFFKTLADSVRSDRTSRDVLNNLTHEEVGKAPAFHTLLEDADVRRAISAAGLSDDEVASAKAASETAGPQTKPTGRIFAKRTPELEAIADRSDRTARFGTGKARRDQPSLDFLPGEKFLEDDLKPAAEKIGTAVASAVRGIRSLVAPTWAGPKARTTGNVLRERGAELQQRFDRVDEAFHEARKFMDKLPQVATRDFIDRVERGQKQTNPHLQPIADGIRTLLDDRLKQVQALGTGKLTAFIEDYFPHLWKDPKKAAGLYAQLMAKAPLEGGKSFLKARTLPFFADGIAKGLEPVTENPVEAMMLRVREMDKYITAHQSFQELDGMGLMRKLPARDRVPVGYAEINDNIAKVFAKPSRRGAVQLQARYVAPEAVATVINNHLSPGLRDNKAFGGAFRMWLGTGNLLNQVQLAVPGFHLALTVGESAVSKFALGLKQIAAGKVVGGAASLAKAMSVVEPVIENTLRGNRLYKEWRKPGSTDPQTAALADWLKASGGRPSMDSFYHTGITDKMVQAFRKGNFIGAALRLPAAIPEMLAKPVLEKLVPRVKLGAFMDMARFEMEKLGPGATRKQVREAGGKAWDSVDNRLGELVYDNLFWHKAVKDLAMASVRSVGWNLGTLRELGGGVADLASIPAKLAMGKKVEFTHRAAYTVALPILTGMIGGLIHYALTGDHPKELKDWYFPKTGEKDKNGHDVRLTLPSYMKDVFSYASDPLKTLEDKVHPMLNTVLEMLANEDYYGTKIRNEDDPFVKKMLDEATFAGKQFAPFSIREVLKLKEQGQGARSLLPLAGIGKARKDITNSPAELKAASLMQHDVRTQEQADHAATVRDFAERLKEKDATVRPEIAEAYRGGKLTEADLEGIRSRLKRGGLAAMIVHLDVKDAMKVWNVASPEERKSIGPGMFSKLRSSKALTRDERVAIVKQLQADWKALKVGDVSEE
jgi:hypothetical protein